MCEHYFTSDPIPTRPTRVLSIPITILKLLCKNKNKAGKDPEYMANYPCSIYSDNVLFTVKQMKTKKVDISAVIISDLKCVEPKETYWHQKSFGSSIPDNDT